MFMDANKEGRALDRWIEYRTFGGSISKAKEFLSFSEENQKLLVKRKFLLLKIQHKHMGPKMILVIILVNIAIYLATVFIQEKI